MITVFGSINLDLIGRVGRLPGPGETVPGDSFATAAGGKGANQALAARRAGAAVRMIGAVGDDGFAAPALALLEADGVDLSRVRRVGLPTGVALILVDAAGENVIAVIPGANGALAAADASIPFRPDDVLLLQLEVPVEAIEGAAAEARRAGARVILNFAPFRADAVHLVRQATHLVVNESECALIAGSFGAGSGAVEAQARALAELASVTVVVTLGRNGVLVVDDGAMHRAPALKVDAIDTVGAGDTFCGYLAAGLGEGLPLAEALRLAAAAGSLACTKAGAQPAIPHRAEVTAALQAGR